VNLQFAAKSSNALHPLSTNTCSTDPMCSGGSNYLRPCYSNKYCFKV
jgi:hypothetical protein